MKNWDAILCEHGGVLLPSELPELFDALERAVRAGVLARILPGSYVDARQADDPLAVVAAAARRHPDAVLTGHAAAALTFWDDHRPTPIEMAGVRTRSTSARIAFSRRLIPPEWQIARHGIRMTTPALTSMDLAVETGGDSIDCVLRTRRATLVQLADALSVSTGRFDNPGRRQLLWDSRENPWSRAERTAHRLLRDAGLHGWTGNHRVICDGMEYFLDVAFLDERVAVEIDGRQFHGPSQFEGDRHRNNHLVCDGWIVVHLTWTMLATDPRGVIRTVNQALSRSRSLAHRVAR